MKMPNINAAIASTYQTQQRLTGLFVSMGSILAIILEIGLVVAGFTIVGSRVTPGLQILWGCIGLLFALLVTKLTLTNATKLRISKDNEKVLRIAHKERGKDLGTIPANVQAALDQDIAETQTGRITIRFLIGMGALMSIVCETFVMHLLFTAVHPAILGDALSIFLSCLVTSTVVSGELHKERDADIIRNALTHDSFLELAAKATVYDGFNRKLIREASTHVEETLDRDVMGEYARRLVFTSIEESTGTRNFALQIEQVKARRLQENRRSDDAEVRMLKCLRGQNDVDTEPNQVMRGETLDRPVEPNQGFIFDDGQAVNEPVSSIQGFVSKTTQYDSEYADLIEKLYHENPNITPNEIVRRLGCKRPTAIKWLARVKPVSE